MNSAYYINNFNIVISVTAFIISLLLVIYARQKYHVPGATWFVWLILSIGWVTFWYIFEAAAGTDLERYLTASKFEYVGLSFLPLVWFGFAITLRGKEKPFSLVWLAILSIIPLITIALVFTNEWHGLIWQVPQFENMGGYPVFAPIYGAWFWIYVIYSYVIFLMGSVLLVLHSLTSWRTYRLQGLVVLIGTLLPSLSNLLDIFDDLNPLPYVYLNAIFLVGSLLCFALALFRLQLFDLMPLAYDTIFNNLPEGIIVTDYKHRIVAMNRAAQPFLDTSIKRAVGQVLASVPSRYRLVFESLQNADEHKVRIPADGEIVEVRVSPVIKGDKAQRGHLFMINNVTGEVKAEQIQRDQKIFAENMRQFGNTLNSTHDPEAVLAIILESIQHWIPYTHANVMVLDEDGFTIRVKQHRGYSAEAAVSLEERSHDYRQFPLYLRVTESSEPLIVPHTRLDPEWIVLPGLEDVQSFATAPILADKTLIGFINVDGTIAGMMKPEMAQRLQIFAQQTAIAIQNARLYQQINHQSEELQRRVNALTITEQVYKEIGSSLNAKNQLEMAMDAILRLMLADGGCVAVMENERLVITHCYGNYALDELALMFNQQTGIIGKALTEKQMQIILPPTPVESALLGAKAQIAIPLYIHSRGGTSICYGLILTETFVPERFTPDRIQVLDLIADRVALALQNVRLVDTIRDRAAELEGLYGKVSHLEQIKSDMIRIAAHDLKNPLSVILLYLENLTEGDPEHIDTKRIYPAMNRSAKRMLEIIQNFLSLERIEQAAENQTWVRMNLSRLVTKAIEEFSGAAAEKSQALALDAPDKECMVYGDPSQIYEAITNFVGNAIKYTPEHGQINVCLEIEGQFAQFSVQDTGYGIPEAEQRKLFQPFQRAYSAETKTIEGTGLGLHLTKNIIERHEGQVIFKSVYKQGSTFGFRLPLNPLRSGVKQ